MLPRIDHPHVRHAKLEVVVDSVLHTTHRVVGRYDFDVEIRRRREYFFVWERSFGDDDIRNPNLAGADQNAKLCQWLEMQGLSALNKPG